MAQRQTLPVLPLRGTVIFPGLTAPIAAGRPGTLRAIEAALKGDRLVFAVAQRDNTDEPTPEILYSMGVIARIGQIQRGLGGGMLVAMPTAMPAAPFASRFGKAAGQHDRLLVLAVIGLAEIDGVLVDARRASPGDGREPALGVAHRRGVIAVDIAEIALAVDQRVALGEILRQPDQRLVDRRFAMRVELADHVADDAGAFLVAASRDRAAASCIA